MILKLPVRVITIGILCLSAQNTNAQECCATNCGAECVYNIVCNDVMNPLSDDCRDYLSDLCVQNSLFGDLPRCFNIDCGESWDNDHDNTIYWNLRYLKTCPCTCGGTCGSSFLVDNDGCDSDSRISANGHSELIPWASCVDGYRSCCGSGEIFYAYSLNGDGICKAPRTWRRLRELDIFEGNNCNTTMYQLGVQTTGSSQAHLSFVAKPKCDTSNEESCECPFLSFDSVPDSGDGNLNHVIQVLNEKDVFPDEDPNNFLLGLFSLKAILDAFTTASDQDYGTKYDFLVDNCATFLISMGLKLGIDPADKKISSFIVQQISTEFVMKKLLETDDGKIHTNIYDGHNEAVVVEEFISHYIHEHI